MREIRQQECEDLLVDEELGTGEIMRLLERSYEIVDSLG